MSIILVLAISPYGSLCCCGATYGKPRSNPVLRSPPRHQVVLHMYQPTVLNSLVLETLPMAALNNLPPSTFRNSGRPLALGGAAS